MQEQSLNRLSDMREGDYLCDYTSARSSIWIERLTTDQKVGSSSLSGRAPFASARGNPSGSFEFGFAEHPRS